MNIYNKLNQIIQKIVKEEIASGVGLISELLDRINVEPPKDASHGDFSSNAALVLAKTLKRSPRELAQEIATALKAQPGIENVEIAGPGFINIWMAEQFWRDRLKEILLTGVSYGDSDLGKQETINVEFVS
ncbi:MAG: arginine--tRNA ligase, partial [Pseudomonadota bacterium]|nr:arginine--tRNA ligase [Pseudomonadota bacterium]